MLFVRYFAIIPFRMSIVEIETDLTYPVVSALPTSGREFYLSLADDDFISKERLRHPERALELDSEYAMARQLFLANPETQNLDGLRRAIGYSGGFNLIDSIRLIRWDGSEDTDFPQMRLGPSAATQVLEIADVNSDDRVLELFSGGGYFTFFLAISGPQQLTSVDLYTPQTYDLESTLKSTYRGIFSRLPDEVKPALTIPNFIQADCTDLPEFDMGFNKVFLHPPFGRESREIVDLSETQAFILWLRSLISVHEANKGSFQTFSVIPSEWTKTVSNIKQGATLGEAIVGLEKRIQGNLYYRQNGLSKDVQMTQADWKKLGEIFNDAVVNEMESRRVKVSLLTTNHNATADS